MSLARIRRIPKPAEPPKTWQNYPVVLTWYYGETVYARVVSFMPSLPAPGHGHWIPTPGNLVSNGQWVSAPLDAWLRMEYGDGQVFEYEPLPLRPPEGT